MNKKVADFFNGFTNVLIIDNTFKITREVNDNTGIEYYREMFINNFNGEYEELLWNEHYKNPNKKKAKDPDNPKTTGGKKSYAMLMLEELDKLRDELKENGVKNIEEVYGYIFTLSKYIVWGTGRLVQKKRSKKPLQYNDMLEIFNCSRPKLDKMLKILKDNDLLSYKNGEGYFISPRIIKKGKTK